MARRRNRGAKKRAPGGRARGLKGRGDYEISDGEPLGGYSPDVAVAELRKDVKALRDAVKTRRAFEKTGSALGGMVGLPIAGTRVGGAVASLLGHGDYTVRVNSLMGGKLPPDSKIAGSMVPYFSKSGRHGVRVVEREYLGDVVTGAAGVFTNSSYPINPGLAGTFPWLSTIANSWEEYEFLGLVFEFVSTSASYGGGTSQALGAVAMAVDYDPLDPSYGNMIQLQNAEGACSTRSASDLFMGVECDRSERGPRTLYTRLGAIPSGGTLMDFDWGNFQVATAGSPAAGATTVGQVWASYDVVLYKKDNNFGAGGPILSTALTKGTGTVAAATLLGTLGTIPRYGSLALTVTTVGGATVINFPSYVRSGSFEVSWYWQGSATTITQPTITYSNCAVPTLSPPSSAGVYLSPGSGTTSAVVMTNVVTIMVTGPSATITYASAVVPSSASVAQCIVTELLDCSSAWPNTGPV